LTKGDFEVGDVLGVDHAGKMIHFASNEGNPLEQQLWQVSFDGERKQLTAMPGTHEGNFAPMGGGFVDKQSTRDPADAAALPGGREVQYILDDAGDGALPLHAPEQLQVKAHDGSNALCHAAAAQGATNAKRLPSR
jgi:dipeptidyl-peptidase-4